MKTRVIRIYNEKFRERFYIAQKWDTPPGEQHPCWCFIEEDTDFMRIRATADRVARGGTEEEVVYETGVDGVLQ
ncbi:MAG TPA: hypothetical protein VFA39_15525 [Steroidobacteraceae bacterium]|nr:hypothetical protein [Steroidobacteraceae bacterium]